MRIVVADDHPVVLSGLNSLLDLSPGFNVVASVVNGAEALRSIQQLEPDLALLDINMPGLTGLEILDALEAQGAATRVVLLTASATDTQITTAVTKGAWGLLLKDTAADTLLECIDAVSRGERWLPADLVDPAFQREAERRRTSANFDALTLREKEIVALVAKGLSNKHIARQTQISEGTVKIHLHNTYQKLGVRNRTSLATLAQSFRGASDVTSR